MSQTIENVGSATESWAKGAGLDCRFQESCDSTSDWAKSEKVESGVCLYLTNHQTKGRGRGNNDWTDLGEGKYLLSTWSFPLGQPPQHITAPLFGLAVFEAARDCWPSLEWSLKAPNDIYISDKKVGGLLMETILQGDRSLLLAGFGLNVLSAPESVPTAGCLTDTNGVGGELEPDRWNQFLTSLFENLKQASQDCQKQELTQGHRESLVEALNFNPVRPGLVLEVSANGDIVMEKQTLHWTEL